MGISLSGGPWQYNRFSSLDEGSKPDYLDFDKDGNKEEPMKKALKEKGKKPCPKCEDKESPCGCHDTVKEWVESLLEGGYDLSEYTWDQMVEMFDEGWNPIDKEKQGKIDRQIGRAADKEAIERGKSKKYGRDEKQIEKQYQRQQAMRFGKKMKKEEVESYLVSEGFASNPVSAEVLFNHMSKDWLEAIEKSLG
jgi:hypothetical protein